MKKTLILLGVLFASAAQAYPYGTYQNPVEDPPFEGDWSVPVHRGMYCVQGVWHRGWLRPWEGKMVVKPSCGDAVNQLPF